MSHFTWRARPDDAAFGCYAVAPVLEFTNSARFTPCEPAAARYPVHHSLETQQQIKTTPVGWRSFAGGPDRIRTGDLLRDREA